MDEDEEKHELPDFIDFREASVSFKVETTTNGDAGNYTLVTQISYKDYPTAMRECQTELEVLPAYTANITVNAAPYFVETLNFMNLTAVCSEFWVYNLPEIKDPNEFDTVDVIFNAKSAIGFLNYDETSKRLFIGANVTTLEDEGTYDFNIILNDGTINITYALRLTLIPEAVNETVPDPYIPRRDIPSPLPYIYKITPLGKVYVRFNTTMVIPVDESKREKEQVFPQPELFD